jgi:hypothetical protein
MYDTDADDGRTADDYPPESSPSTDTFAVAELNHAPDAHTASEYHEPPPSRRRSPDTMVRHRSTTAEVVL